LFSKVVEKKQISLIYDIGSGSVAGALVELSKGKNPRIIYSKRIPINVQEVLDSETLQKSLLKSLNEVSEKVNREGLQHLNFKRKRGRKIDSVTCTLASPWFTSQTKEIGIAKEQSFTVTRSFLDKLIDRETEKFQDSQLGKLSDDSSEVIERRFTEIKLNDYETDNPYGKKATEVDIALFMSIAPSNLLDGIEDVVSKHFFFEYIKFHSFALVSFSVIRDIHERIKDFVLLDITAEVTDVSIVKRGAVLETGSFPLGQNFLIRAATKSLKTVPHEAVSSLKRYLRGDINKERASTLEKILAKAKEKWLKSFQDILVKLSAESYIPKTVFFMTDDDLAPWFTEVIKSERFVQYTLSDEPFVVNFIDSSSLISHVEFEGGRKIDPFIATEAIFFNKLFELED
jgi:cell division ATPase FtsA